MTAPLIEAELFNAAFLAKLDRLALVMKHALAGDLQGERRSTRRGASVEFADFKPYVSGDDFRQIDWNVYARLDRFFLKLFVAEDEATIHLLIDTSRSMDWGQPNKLSYAKQVTGALGYIALANLDRVVLTAFGQQRLVQLAPQRTKSHAHRLFQFLQKLGSGGRTELATVCRRYTLSAGKPGALLLCTDLFDREWQDALQALVSRGFEITLLQILAPQEVEPLIEGDVRLIDAEGGEAVDMTADSEALSKYRAGLLEWRAEIAAFCAARAISYVPLTTDIPIDAVLFHLLHRRGLLR